MAVWDVFVLHLENCNCRTCAHQATASNPWKWTRVRSYLPNCGVVFVLAGVTLLGGFSDRLTASLGTLVWNTAYDFDILLRSKRSLFLSLTLTLFRGTMCTEVQTLLGLFACTTRRRGNCVHHSGRLHSELHFMLGTISIIDIDIYRNTEFCFKIFTTLHHNEWSWRILRYRVQMRNRCIFSNARHIRKYPCNVRPCVPVSQNWMTRWLH